MVQCYNVRDTIVTPVKRVRAESSGFEGGKKLSEKRILLTYLLFVLFVNSVLFMLLDCDGNVRGENDYTDSSDMPLEMVISRRLSIHYGDYYNLSAPVPWELVSKVLWAAYGYSTQGRTVPSLSLKPKASLSGKRATTESLAALILLQYSCL